MHTKYNIIAIPTLIFVDGKTGKVISEEGRSIVRNDPTGEKFPWKPRPFSEIIAGAKFIDQNEKERTWGQLQGKVIGLFFSGYWVRFQFTYTITVYETNARHDLQDNVYDMDFMSLITCYTLKIDHDLA